ncbi:MAG: hydroxymethylbilane synthase [Acidimicrobiales bacterium]|nr:hydroxymethylbilane synthase [Acidimicrobiales bacterium]
MRALRLGTRASALAVAQSGQVADSLRARGARIELVPMTTPGDLDGAPLAGRAAEGIFVSSVREALLDGSIDLAVHSFKDVPTGNVQGLAFGAVPAREDPRDTLLTRGPAIDALPTGARVGTCSIRRSAWVTRARPHVTVMPIRGSIDHRIDRLVAGDFDAIVLAQAGLNRLGCSVPARQVVPVLDLVPAPAQGALAVECRSGDAATRSVLAVIDDARTRAAATVERAVLEAIDPTDGTALGAVAVVSRGWLHLLADLAWPDGSGRVVVRMSEWTGESGLDEHRLDGIGRSVAARLVRRHGTGQLRLAS